MPKDDWTRIAENSPHYEAEDFRSAAYRLVTEQVLYEFVPHQRLSYRIVKEHERDFTEICSLLGMSLAVSSASGYACAWPVHEKTTPLTLPETLLALVLRRIYHEKRQAGEGEAGRVEVSLEELSTIYEEATGRDLPHRRGEMESLLGRMQRFGIARARTTDDTDPQPFGVEILPAIEILIDQVRLAELDAHALTVRSRSVSESSHEETSEEADPDESA